MQITSDSITVQSLRAYASNIPQNLILIAITTIHISQLRHVRESHQLQADRLVQGKRLCVAFQCLS